MRQETGPHPNPVGPVVVSAPTTHRATANGWLWGEGSETHPPGDAGPGPSADCPLAPQGAEPGTGAHTTQETTMRLFWKAVIATANAMHRAAGVK